MFKRRRLASRDKQSSTAIPPCVRDPSLSMILNIRSKAFSNAISFWRSGDDGVSAVSKSNPSRNSVSF